MVRIRRTVYPAKGVLLLLLLILLVPPAIAGNSLTVSGIILPVQKPVAEFLGTPSSGYAPLHVQFTDQSTNTPASWKWEYRGDTGPWTQFSTTQNPSFSFTTAGHYSIRLTATNAGGSDTATKNNYLTVTPPLRPPVALFTQDKYIGRAPLTVRFTDRSLNSPASWEWRFGDGDTSSERNPVHTYTRPGLYIIRERVSNAAGSDTALGAVIVMSGRWW
jgi:PKD repeat protein